MALFTMFGGVIRVSTDISSAPGADPLSLLLIGNKLASVTEPVVAVVQNALEGNGITIEAASLQITILLNSAAL